MHALNTQTPQVLNNTAVGKSSLIANTTGADNVAMGVNSLDANTTGNYNVAIGTAALTTNTLHLIIRQLVKVLYH